MRTATIVAGRTLAIAVYAFTLGALWLLAQATPPRLKFDAFAGLGSLVVVRIVTYRQPLRLVS